MFTILQVRLYAWLTHVQYFRHRPIEELAGNGKRVTWSAVDQRLFRQHAARYQMSTKQMLTLGTDELMTQLGISARSQEYKQIIWKRVSSALEYLVCTSLRRNTLLQAQYKDPHTGSTRIAWRWPRYTIEWLRSDWDGDEDNPNDDDDSHELRDEAPGERAVTPGSAKEQSDGSLLHTTRQVSTESLTERRSGRLHERRGTEAIPISINDPLQNSTERRPFHQRRGTEAAPIPINDTLSDGETTPTRPRNVHVTPRINTRTASRTQPGARIRQVPIRPRPKLVPRTARVPETRRESTRTQAPTLKLAEQSRVEEILESIRSLPSPPQESPSIYDDPSTWPDAPTDEEIRQIQEAQSRSEFTFAQVSSSQDQDNDVNWEPLYPTLPSLPAAPPPTDALSQKALETASESLKYAVHEMKYWTLAEIAASHGDDDWEYRSTCAARYAGVMREQMALQAWQDAKESCQSMTGDETMSPIWTLLLKFGR